jgi:hypothetical protein
MDLKTHKSANDGIESIKNKKILKLKHWIKRYNPIEVYQNNYVLDNSENSLTIVRDWMYGAPNQIWTIVKCNRSNEKPIIIVPGYKPKRSLGYLLATKIHQNEPFTYVY